MSLADEMEIIRRIWLVPLGEGGVHDAGNGKLKRRLTCVGARIHSRLADR